LDPWDLGVDKMSNDFPSLLSEAISKGIWRDPGPFAMTRKVLTLNLDLPALQLFESYELMSSVHAQIRSGGYVEDPKFCMVKQSNSKTHDRDHRLNLESALFIAGSIVPGDDVFVALDLDSDKNDPDVLIFDWRKPVPDRWIKVMTLRQLINKLSRMSHPGTG
jgi:hypothetical protein